MAYAITQTCCSDATCVSVCPVNCIHPTPAEPDFGKAEMLYVDPQTCIDCGACADACPVDAIFPSDQLTGSKAVYVELNREFYQRREVANAPDVPHFPRSLPRDVPNLRVAVVGTGPAAWYTADLLVRDIGAEVTMIDKLPVSGGLIRFGVAPDHPATKKIGDSFSTLLHHPRLRMLMNVEVGKDITPADLTEHHHAVIYAVGASADNTLGIPGESLDGSLSATKFVAWYNAHPDAADTEVDLSGERAVVIGNGNVAVDVARILVSDPVSLARTDIADHALATLRSSAVREVVLLGRRGPDEASYTDSELLALKHLPGVELVVEDHPMVRSAIATAAPGSKAALLADLPLVQIDWSAPPAGKRIVLRFLSSATEIVGRKSVEAVEVTRNVEHHNADADDLAAVAITAAHDTIPAGLVLRAIGYRGRPLDGLPFDPHTATIPNDAGRVIDPQTGAPVPGTYVVGWIKRGPSGGIGANRECATETVETLLDDATAHLLRGEVESARHFDRLIHRKKPDSINRKTLLAIDQAERDRGAAVGRPRVKFATVDELLSAAKRH
ncbi:ferredoxin--NADP+ reductase [Frankineae bacterium MT45]|nr:ferredoxin--NADP+ reductase [Frankineae bacterium MT45]